MYFLCNDCDSKSMCVVGVIPNSDSSESLTNTSNQLSNIEERLSKKITTKLKDAMDQVETQVNKILDQGYADIVKKNLRTIIREERNELRVQEAEKESRARSCIIHGIQWDQTEFDFGNKLKEKDRVFVEDFLTVLGTPGKPSECHRLGRFVPVKVVMPSFQKKKKS